MALRGGSLLDSQVVVLEKCALEVVAPRKGAVELLNSDDHKVCGGFGIRKVAALGQKVCTNSKKHRRFGLKWF